MSKKKYLESVFHKASVLSMLVLMFSMCCCILSCGDDDDDDNGDAQKELLGIWVINSSQHVSGNGTAKSVFRYWKRGTRLSFYSDNTYTDTSDGGTIRHSYRYVKKSDGSGMLTLGDDGERFRLDGDGHGEQTVTYPYDEHGDTDYEDGEDHWKWEWEWEGPAEDEPDNESEPEPGTPHCPCDYLPYPYPTEIPIYEGDTPPNIEGVYLMSPYVTVFCSDGYYKAGTNMTEEDYIRFSNQDMKTNTLNYANNAFSTKNGNLLANEAGNGAFISGNGDNFTVFFITNGLAKNISVRTLTLLSGTKTSNGIQNLYYLTKLVEKGYDPNNTIMAVGTYRIFRDGDAFSPFTEWRTRSGEQTSILKSGNSFKGIERLISSK